MMYYTPLLVEISLYVTFSQPAQKRGKNDIIASERTGEHRGVQVRERATKEYMAKTYIVDEIARRSSVTDTLTRG